MGNQNKIVAIVGMCGSGKSVVTATFVEQGWNMEYFGKITMDTLAERHMEVTPENEKMVREGLRKELGPDAYAKKLLPIISKDLETGNTVLDGLYSWSEYKYLKEHLETDFIVLAVITNREDRYHRLTSREIRPLTTEQANARDIAEIENLEKGGPIAMADYFIMNDGSEADLKQATLDFIAKRG
ncbi:MAG TPA: AAA family ATPase [Lachnospiraceae bacterium]|jgi:dephospho-CoA kinase|nr:AAA family ATPase [Lachnospiraceae bacterium]